MLEWVPKVLLWRMITKGSQDSSRMKTSSHVRGLIWKIKVCNLGFEVFKEKHIARSDISMYNGRLNLLMQVFQTSGRIDRNPDPLHPIKCRTWLCPLDSFSTYNSNSTFSQLMFSTMWSKSRELYRKQMWDHIEMLF